MRCRSERGRMSLWPTAEPHSAVSARYYARPRRGMVRMATLWTPHCGPTGSTGSGRPAIASQLRMVRTSIWASRRVTSKIAPQSRKICTNGSSSWEQRTEKRDNDGAVPKRRRPHSYWICHRICALGPAGNSGNPHRKCDSRFPPGIPVLSRSPVPTSPAAEYGPVHCSRLADAAAYAGSARGALNPSFSKRSAIFCAMAWPWPLSTSAMMEPPKPPPVIRAP